MFIPKRVIFPRNGLLSGRLPRRQQTASVRQPRHAELQDYHGEDLRPAIFRSGFAVHTYAFNYLEAQRAFRQAQQLDPHCTMCFWGQALVPGPNINTPMETSTVSPAWAAITQAKGLARHTSVKERALIEALANVTPRIPKPIASA